MVGGRAVDKVVVGGSAGGIIVLGTAAGPGPVRQAVGLQKELANPLTGTRIFQPGGATGCCHVEAGREEGAHKDGPQHLIPPFSLFSAGSHLQVLWV